MQIKGRQTLWVIRSSFEAQTGQRIKYELMALVNIPYAGVANMASWKAHWDDMVRNQWSSLTPEQLREIFFNKVRASDALKAYTDYFNRLAYDHHEKSYKFLSDSMDKVIQEMRNLLNTQSLTS